MAEIGADRIRESPQPGLERDAQPREIIHTLRRVGHPTTPRLTLAFQRVAQIDDRGIHGSAQTLG
ncbi:MAG TPA: hypothetical protein VJ833_07490 [Rhodanobacteraceae bacterium]|nr:hypothetical protein [Rhodanobacteraceae bacterium]